MKNEPIRCIFIDDEPLALEVLTLHLSNYPQLCIVERFSNAVDAIQWMKNNTVDAIFTDIQMPGISGLELVKNQYPAPHAVIFTTAYPNYAPEAFEFEALDYLLKPISPERIQKTIARLEEFQSLKYSQTQDSSLRPDFVYIKIDGHHQKIHYADILYVEAFADYIKIWIGPEKRLVTLQTMRNMEKALPPDLFIRIHRSFIVSKNNVVSIQQNGVKIGNKILPIGKNYKESILALVNKHRLQ
ncbi:MAG: response regulator transcription factor [Flavobacteriaceae bacterium]|nr:response regulator transcription factor [Flavobacteriaceae bacterium]